jgi:hypothetical protein
MLEPFPFVWMHPVQQLLHDVAWGVPRFGIAVRCCIAWRFDVSMLCQSGHSCGNPMPGSVRRNGDGWIDPGIRGNPDASCIGNHAVTK